jgi:hypothetical protein
MVTVVEHVAVLPHASVAVNITVVIPGLGYTPLAFAPEPLPVFAPDFTYENVIAPAQLSVAVAAGIV